jgi:hypothetical protein
LLTLAIGVNENTIYGYGDVAVNCSNSGGGVGSSLSLSGPVASDGSFLLTNSAFPADTIQVSIQGKAPAAGSTTWTGSYTITNAAAQPQCTFDYSSNFVATAYPPLDGTYAGTFGDQNSGSNLTVSTQITQGALTLTNSSSSLARGFNIPLNGTIAVTGSPCFTTGITTQEATGPTTIPVQGWVGGNTFSLNYVMNDGAQLQLLGYFADSSESGLYIQLAIVFGGKCDGILGGGGNSTYSGTLTRQ